MNLDENTFGKSPAANYLVRELNYYNDKKLTRSCTVRVNVFYRNVSAIVESVGANNMSAKVAANLLRLLREDATKITMDVNTEFVCNLLRNTIIGHIKSAMRKTETIRKIENGNSTYQNLRHRGSINHVYSSTDRTVYNILGYIAGETQLISYDHSGGQTMLYSREFPHIDTIIDPITPELLHTRSVMRCKRLGKVWTK